MVNAALGVATESQRSITGKLIAESVVVLTASHRSGTVGPRLFQVRRQDEATSRENRSCLMYRSWLKVMMQPQRV